MDRGLHNKRPRLVLRHPPHPRSASVASPQQLVQHMGVGRSREHSKKTYARTVNDFFFVYACIISHPDGSHAVLLSAVVVHDGDAVVPDVPLLLVALRVGRFRRHHRRHVEHGCARAGKRNTGQLNQLFVAEISNKWQISWFFLGNKLDFCPRILGSKGKYPVYCQENTRIIVLSLKGIFPPF